MGENMILSDKTCKKCGKVFKGTVKEKKCERCRSIDAERWKKGGTIFTVAAVVIGGIIKAILNKDD